jgi:hypothetical protein
LPTPLARVALTAVVFAAVASRALGQQPTDPLPAPDEPVKHLPPSEPLAAAPMTVVEQKGPASEWSALFGIGGGYDSNVDFLPKGDPTAVDLERGDFSGRLQGSLKAQFARRSWILVLQGDGSGIAYRNATGYDVFIYGGGVNTGGKISSLTRVSADLSYHRDYTRNLLRIADAALVEGRFLTNLATGSAQVSHRIKPLIGLVVGAVYERITFENDLPGGDTLSLNAGLSWTPRERDKVNAYFVHRRTVARGDIGNSDGIEMSWDRRLTSQMDTGVTVGLNRSDLLRRTEKGRSTFESLAGRLAGRHRRHALSAKFDHSLAQAYGLGRSLIFDVLTVDDGYSVTPRLNLALRGSFSRGHDPDIDYRLKGEGLSSILTYQLAPRTTGRFSYSFWTRRETGGRPVYAHVLELSLLYGRSAHF